MKALMLFVCCWFSSIALAQVQFKGFHYTTDEGLPSNTVYSITEDRNGDMVLGTDNGLTFFDGNEFRNLNVEDGLVNPYIVAVTKDKKGTIWLINYGGRLQKLVGNKLITTNIFTEYYNQIQSVGKSLFLFTTQARQTDKLYKSVELFTDKNLQVNADTLKVNPMLAPPVLEQNGEFISVENRIVTYRNYSIALPNSVQLLHKVIFRKKDVCLLDDQNLVLVDFKGNVLKTIPLPQQLSKKRFYKFDFIVNQKEDCWLSIQGKGLFILRDDTWQNVHESLGLNEDQNINFLYCDSKGRIWIATHENGLFCIPNSNIEILKLPGTENNFNSFATSSDKQSLYIATNFKLYKYAHGQFNFTEKALLPIKLDNLDGQPVYCFPYFKVDKNDTELQSLPRMIGKQFLKKEGAIYYSLFGLSSIAIWERKNKGSVVKYITNKVPSNEKIRKVVFYKNEYYFNNNETIDIRTFDSEFIYKKRPLKIKIKGFISDFEFINDTMWVAANNVIYKVFNEKVVDTITQINSIQFYNIRKIKAINKDVYVCAGNGLFKISAAGNRILNKYNYLPNNDVYNVELFHNELFVATIDGMSKIVNSEIQAPSEAPTFKVLYNNQNVVDINLPKEVENIVLQLRIQNFHDKKNQLVEYKMDDSPWTVLLNTDLNLQELTYGNHKIQFRVKDINSDWKTKTITIYRAYPFYKQWEFYVLVFVLLLLIVYLVYRYEINTIKIKKQYEIDRNNKIVELRQSALTAMMNPHFIFNSLNAIQYFINSHQTNQSSDYLAKLARLVRMFLQHSSQPFITLEAEIERLKLYVELEQLRFSHFDFELDIDPKLEESAIRIPNMIVQPFIENAILHGISHLQEADRKVGLHFEIVGNLLIIIITDNGYGASASPNKNTNHVSKGIQIITERLELLQQSYPKKVFTLTEEALNPSSDRKGHKVTLRITIL